MALLNRIKGEHKYPKVMPLNTKTMVNSGLDRIKKKDIPVQIKEALGIMLTVEEEMFVTENAADLNLENAYKKAFYPNKLIAINILQHAALRLMKLPHIREAIKKQLAARMERINMNGDKILAEISYLAFSNMKDVFNDKNVIRGINDLPDSVSRAIQTYEIDTRGNVKVRFYDKHKALQEIGLYLGLFDPDKNKNMDDTARKVRDAVAEMKKLTVGE